MSQDNREPGNRHHRRPNAKKKLPTKSELDLPILGASKSHASDQKVLDTGMRLGEAIAQAQFWWDNKGRALIRDKNYASDNPGFGSFNPNPTSDEEADNWLPSNILMGKPWDDLKKDEKLTIVKFWHHNHVRAPNIDPELYLRAKARPGICFYCDEEASAEEVLPNGERREMCYGHAAHRYKDDAINHAAQIIGHSENDAEG